MEKYSIISKEINKLHDNYKYVLKCNIHNYEYTVEGTYKHVKAIFSASSCGCPHCNMNSTNSLITRKQEKIKILTEYDLNNLHWAIILDLIGIDKLPKEFSQLCKFGENTPERKKMIQDLIDTYNIDIDEIEDNTIDENIEEEVSDIPEEEILNEDIYSEDNDTELKPFKDIKKIADIINEDNIEVFSTGDKWLHIISKEMSKLWNAVLRDDENHTTNTINDIKNKLNGTLTKFEEYIYTEFLKEYEEVINFEVS